jgi:acyl transferase domain-containing protein
VEYALAGLWMSLGVRPAMMIGHSMGEYVAAALAGVMSLPDATRLVAHRARLMGDLPAGSMLIVAAPEPVVRELLTEGVSLAAINAPSQVVVSGPTELVDQVEAALTERDLGVRRLRFGASAHSVLIEAILPEFAELVATVATAKPHVPCISNLTGTWLTGDQAMDPGYWVRHLRAPVRFADGVATVLATGPVVLLEVGPGTTLTTLGRQNGAAATIASLRHPLDPRPDAAALATAAAELWLAGVPVDWPVWDAHFPATVESYQDITSPI